MRHLPLPLPASCSSPNSRIVSSVANRGSPRASRRRTRFLSDQPLQDRNDVASSENSRLFMAPPPPPGRSCRLKLIAAGTTSVHQGPGGHNSNRSCREWSADVLAHRAGHRSTPAIAARAGRGGAQAARSGCGERPIQWPAAIHQGGGRSPRLHRGARRHPSDETWNDGTSALDKQAHRLIAPQSLTIGFLWLHRPRAKAAARVASSRSPSTRSGARLVASTCTAGQGSEHARNQGWRSPPKRVHNCRAPAAAAAIEASVVPSPPQAGRQEWG